MFRSNKNDDWKESGEQDGQETYKNRNDNFGNRRGGGSRYNNRPRTYNHSNDNNNSYRNNDNYRNGSSDNNERPRPHNAKIFSNSNFRNNKFPVNDQVSTNEEGFRNGSSSQESDIIEMDPEKVKFIIGKGGAKIHDIERRCQVHVQIGKKPNENGLIQIILYGKLYSISKAKRIMESIIGYNKNAAQAQNTSQYTSNEQNDDRPHSNNFRDNHEHRQLNNERNLECNAEPINDEELVPAPIDWERLNKSCDDARLARWEKCPKLIKNFYKEVPVVTNLTIEEVDKFREDSNNIIVAHAFSDAQNKENPIPNPVQEFWHCFQDYPDLMDEINKQGFAKPTPIQAQGWPILLSGEDMIGIAQTGTGKTLAFLLPGMIHTELQPTPRKERSGPNVLVLAPTRELALQIEQEVKKYQFRDMKAVCVYGGGDRNDQVNLITNGVEIVIATPGRLNDLIEAKVVDVTSVSYLVLDEADRMLDMGFEPQIRKILLDIRPDKQTIMTSATWPSGVRRLAQSYMNNPIQVYVGSLDLAAVHSVTQRIEIIDEDDKLRKVLRFVKEEMKENDKAIIFCSKKTRADELSSEFCLKNINCQCIHGGRDQSDREQALSDIKSGEVQILIATDVASRGIDIEDITYVINFDFPKNVEEYVHRVGRTGRAGRSGIALSYVTRENWGQAEELISILEEANQEIPSELQEMATRFAAMKERRKREKEQFGGGNGGNRGNYGRDEGNGGGRYSRGRGGGGGSGYRGGRGRGFSNGENRGRYENRGRRY